MAAIIPAVALGAAIGNELPKFFDDAFDQIGAGEGVYLRDGEPASLPVKIGQAIGRGYCRAYNDVSTEYPPGKGERIEKACRPYLDSIGAPSPGIELPFRGGQCDVLYEVVTQGDTPRGSNGFGECTGTQPYNLVGALWGPIGAPRKDVQVCGGGVDGDAFDWVVTCHGNSAEPRTAQPVTRLLVGGAYTARISSVTPLNAIPDDCGNPQPVPVPVPTVPGPPPPPFRFNPSPDIDIDIDVSVGPNGDINFDIGTGPITVNPFPDGGGGSGGDGGGGGAPPTPAPGEPGEGGETGGGGGAGGGGTEGEAPDGFVLTGLKLFIIERPPSARRYSEQVDRGVAYVYMGTPDEGLALEPSGANLRDGQFIYAQKEYLTSWAVRATPGYNLLVIPYFREKVSDGSATD